jgi:hypothetical protein
VQAFPKHLAQVFQPHPTQNEPEEEETLIQLLETSYQLEAPNKHLKEQKSKQPSTN